MTMQEINQRLPLTPDWNQERLDTLKNLFPDLFTAEGRLDPDELRKLADPQGLDETERYEFRWFGKSQAKRSAFTPSNATLVFDEKRSLYPAQTKNLIIEGENLEVLKLLSHAYREKIKCIYIDPPYNTGKDFVYSDNFSQNRQAYWEDAGVVEAGVKIDTNSEADGRYHSNWLNMMYSRLLIARQLLREDGVIFISIDDNEMHHLRKLGDEVFGEENWVGTMIWKNATDNNPTQIAIEHEYVICYAKNKADLEPEWKSKVSAVKDILIKIGGELIEKYNEIEILETEYKKWFRSNKSQLWPLDRYKYIDKGGIYTGSQSVHNPGKEGYRYDVIHENTKKPCKQPLMGYRFPEETMNALLEQGKILFGKDESKIIELKLYASDYEDKLSSLIELDGRIGAYDLKELFGDYQKLFTNPKPVDFLNYFLSFVLNDSEIILDFFAGSGSIGQAVIELNLTDNANRKFILVQMPEQTEEKKDPYKAGYKKISDITIERNKRVIEKIVTEKKSRQLGIFNQNESTKGLGFKVFKLTKSNFPRVEWRPEPELTDEDNLAALKKYIADKESQLVTLFNREELTTEILLKKGYTPNYTTEKQPEFRDNEVYLATDGDKETLICLDAILHENTVAHLKTHTAHKFVCLERALDTTKKWNLKNALGEKLQAF